MVLLAIVKVVILVVHASGVKVVLELGFEDSAMAVGSGEGCAVGHLSQGQRWT